MEQKKLDYLTDEELELLIGSIESTEMLKAPSYLRDEIFEKLPAAPVVSTDSRVSPETRDQKKIHLLVYSMKVTLAAVAAILLLFLIPHQGSGQLYKADPGSRQDQITSQINEKSNGFCTTLFELSNKILMK